MTITVVTIERAGLDLMFHLVSEAALGLRRGWTLDRTFEEGAPERRLRRARRRAHLLTLFGHETRVVEEPDTQAVYVWRRA